MQSKTDRIMCGTCEYWTGNRNPVFDRHGIPKIDVIDRLGECENVDGRFFENTRKYDLKCVRYSKWTEIL